MKKFFTVLLMISSISVFAEVEGKVKIKEIKAYLKTIDTETTCMDEYLKRRKQLILSVSFSPVAIAAGTVTSLYAGAAAGAGVAHLASANGLDGLGYVVGGALLGSAAGAVATTIDTTARAVTLSNIDLILKALAEQYLDRDGVRTNKLYSKYLKKSKTDISKEEFIARLMAADANGTLCDGSMVKQPRIKIGPKLKFKVAKLKDLAREL